MTSKLHSVRGLGGWNYRLVHGMRKPCKRWRRCDSRRSRFDPRMQTQANACSNICVDTFYANVTSPHIIFLGTHRIVAPVDVSGVRPRVRLCGGHATSCFHPLFLQGSHIACCFSAGRSFRDFGQAAPPAILLSLWRQDRYAICCLSRWWPR